MRTVRWADEKVGHRSGGSVRGKRGNRMDHSEYDVFSTVREVHCTVAVTYAFPQPQHGNFLSHDVPVDYAGTPRRSMKIQTN